MSKSSAGLIRYFRFFYEEIQILKLILKFNFYYVQDKKGVIKTIYRNFIFLHNTEFINSNGIFVEKSENVEIMGSELLAGEDLSFNSGAKVNFKKIPGKKP